MESNVETARHTVHLPVMPNEVLELGSPEIGQTWIDGTAGGGGHSLLIADAIGATGKLLCIDRDPTAVASLRMLLPANCTCEQASYDQTPDLIADLGWPAADGILLDLGLSSDQLADMNRGFSFQATGDLDMRFDPTQGQPVWQWLQRADERTIADTIYQFGEERFSRRIARRIVELRKKESLRTAEQLREIVYQSVPKSRTAKGKRYGSRKRRTLDPATRTFQALRIMVNDELAILQNALQALIECLLPGGVLLIISFHSLEDRLVKNAFRSDARLDVITRKPVQAQDSELLENPRARSAKLRVARRRPAATATAAAEWANST